MPKGINTIKKNLVKQSILEAKSFKQSLLDAGYSINTAEHKVTKDNKLLTVVMDEIGKEFDKAKITPEYVLAGLDKEAKEAKNSADRIRAYELLGKYLALFIERTQNATNLSIEEVKKQEEALHKRFSLS